MLATQSSLSSINSRKIKFIANIYIRFIQNIDETFYISAKIEAVKHLHAVFLLSAEQHRRPMILKRAVFILTTLTLRDSILLLECKLH